MKNARANLAIALLLASSTTTAMASTITHPIRIATCRPEAVGSAMWSYSDGFYPSYPYYWSDNFGGMFYQPPTRTYPLLSIAYVNQTHRVMKKIEFGLLARGRIVAEVRDLGTFTPGALIRHQFGLSRNVLPLGTSFSKCVPLRIAFKNGTTWKNPHLKQLRRSIFSRR
uniref:Uncharacterized protein n=1 Tax=mine drainage metagenome TaxID=410659 RepID=E6Q211_9ZZZZ